MGKKEYRSPREGEILGFLSRHASSLKNYGDEIRFRPCPECRHDKSSNPSAQIHSKTGLWRCFACGKAGNWFMLTKAFGDPIPKEDRYIIQQYDPVSHESSSWFSRQKRRPVTLGHYPELLEYCSRRGFSNKTLDAWKVSTKGPCSLRWPIYQYEAGKWHIANMRVRTCIIKNESSCRDWFDIKNGPTGLLIGNHLFDPDGPKRFAIFEGQWDAMTAWEIGLRNVFSLPNGCSNVSAGSMLRYLPDRWDVWICTDMDRQGDHAAERFFSQLGFERVKRARLPFKDLNEWFMNDPFITKNDFENTILDPGIKQAANDSSGFMKIDLNVSEEQKKTISCTTPWASVNEMLGGGFLSGQTTGLLAPSGTGKTTFSNHMAVFAAGSGKKIGIISLEGSRDALERKIKPVILGHDGIFETEMIIRNLLVSKLEGKSTTVKQILNEIDFMAQEGISMVIVDNLDFICSDKGDEKAAAYGKIIEKSVLYDIHSIVVWQPNKIDRTQIINSGNQKGYSQTFQDSDNYFNLNIIDGQPVLQLEKHRESGVREKNRASFRYDEKTRMMHEIPATAYSDKNDLFV